MKSISNVKYCRNISFHIPICLILIFCIIPVHFFKANPIPEPNKFYGTYLTLNEHNPTQLQLLEANVTIDCYEKYAIGTGDYLLHNPNNKTESVEFIFYQWEDKIEFLELWVNGTLGISESWNYSCDESSGFYETIYWTPQIRLIGLCDWDDMVLNLSLFANQDALIRFKWKINTYNHENSVSGVNFLSFDDQEFHVGYIVNGGEYWGNQSIQQENIRFNFYSDVWFSEALEVTPIILENNEVTDRSLLSKNYPSIPVSGYDSVLNCSFFQYNQINVLDSYQIHFFRTIRSYDFNGWLFYNWLFISTVVLSGSIMLILNYRMQPFWNIKIGLLGNSILKSFVLAYLFSTNLIQNWLSICYFLSFIILLVDLFFIKKLKTKMGFENKKLVHFSSSNNDIFQKWLKMCVLLLVIYLVPALISKNVQYFVIFGCVGLLLEIVYIRNYWLFFPRNNFNIISKETEKTLP